MKPTRVAFHHFGCKVNFAEASTLARQFAEKGYELTGSREVADIYIISSCMVTSVAEKKCRAAIRQAHAINPEARIAVIGCFSELKAEELNAMPETSLVLGHTAKFTLLQAINSLSGHQSPVTSCQSTPFFPAHSAGDRTRSFLKIQDGCDYHCAYCTIPLARGNSRSETIAKVLEQARVIASSGIQEIVLTGVNIGDFGRPQGETFYELLCAIEEQTDIPRIRISSIEPDLLSPGIIDLVAGSGKFLPHFHIPLQSGCNRVLKAMKRQYTRELYTERVSCILDMMPHACIAADVITGFPGERAEDFQETFGFLQDLRVSYLHVFAYSRRDNTLASLSPGVVPAAEKKDRSRVLQRLSHEKKAVFYRTHQGSVRTVLFESDRKNGFMHGFTDNYIKVKTPYDPLLINRILPVRLLEAGRDECYTTELLTNLITR